MSILMAQDFHETYERLAPSFGYATREASAKPWDKVPLNNQLLMIAVTDEIESRWCSKIEEDAREFSDE